MLFLLFIALFGRYFKSFTSDNYLLQVFLGETVDDLFVEEGAKQIRRDFRVELKKLSLKFHDRNETLKYPYWYLLPEKIPSDINI